MVQLVLGSVEDSETESDTVQCVLFEVVLNSEFLLAQLLRFSDISGNVAFFLLLDNLESISFCFFMHLGHSHGSSHFSSS